MLGNHIISVVVLTFNEEHDLPRCLAALKWCIEVHVLDSGSSDATRAIAEASGARVTTNQFGGFGEQRNYALDHLQISTPWVLFMDADEIATPEFVRELLEKCQSADVQIAGFYCCWKMMLENRWLKRCDSFPKWQLRVVRVGRARFKNFGHGQKEDQIDGKLGFIRTPYEHFAFSKGWSHWVARHNKYSTDEAILRESQALPIGKVFSRNPSHRNAALKMWLYKLPGWPILRFVHAYFFKCGVLEGAQGFIYCVNLGYYEFLIKIKQRELRRNSSRVRSVKDVVT